MVAHRVSVDTTASRHSYTTAANRIHIEIVVSGPTHLNEPQTIGTIQQFLAPESRKYEHVSFTRPGEGIFHGPSLKMPNPRVTLLETL